MISLGKDILIFAKYFKVSPMVSYVLIGAGDKKIK